MGRSYFLRLLLLSALLVLCISQSHGFGRGVTATVEFGDSAVPTKKTAGNSREMIELMDYKLDPEPNTNPKTGYVNGPPPRP